MLNLINWLYPMILLECGRMDLKIQHLGQNMELATNVQKCINMTFFDEFKKTKL
jgi:hypothetical protein